MAILNGNNLYVKINYSECKIMGNNVYVSITEYIDTEQREKEKSRLAQYNVFCENAENYLVENQNNATESAIEKQGKLLCALSLVRRNYIIHNNQSHFDGDVAVLNDLLGLFGFKQEWMTDPIKLGGKKDIFCGEISNISSVNPAFYYDKFKTTMSSCLDV